ncbi:MAG TPA: hypothetical protein VGE23_01775, partial [Candidatus Paceibacterota bacterium]
MRALLVSGAHGFLLEEAIRRKGTAMPEDKAHSPLPTIFLILFILFVCVPVFWYVSHQEREQEPQGSPEAAAAASEVVRRFT